LYVLGIGQIGGHDSSAVLVEDGELRMAVAEERLSRRKHHGGYPRLAVAKVLADAGITLADVEHVALVDRPWHRFFGRTLGWYLPKLLSHPTASVYHTLTREVPVLLDFLAAKRRIREESGGRAQVHFVQHHLAHAASAFLVSPFDESAILTWDARGELESTVLAAGRGATIETLGAARMPHSMGQFYAGVTDHLGFLAGSDEYKVMGLASYGEPVHLDAMRRIVRFEPGRVLVNDLDYFAYQDGRGFLSERFSEHFGSPRRRDEPVEKRHQDLAASAQAALEEVLLALARHLREATGSPRLCMAGGVALNCVANGRLRREGIFDEIFVQPAAGDDGGAIGAAYHVYNTVLGHERDFVMRTANVGPEYGNDTIERALEVCKAPYTKSDDVCAAAAEAIAAGKIVGWYQGRMEFGPRALGSRSILADPTNPGMKDLINRYVKFREEFRPFAPSVKAEAANRYFDMGADSPFMLFVVNVREEAKAKLPAITHVDGTARVQCVHRDVEPRYWRLLDEIEKRNGVPAVLNTSFNVMGEPIVCRPEEAIRCFFSSGMDVLAIGDFLVEKGPVR